LRLTQTQRGRIKQQQGVLGNSAGKAAGTAAARRDGDAMAQGGDQPVAGAAGASSRTCRRSPAQGRLKVLQWAIPG
jgi:hypothetical protein